MSRVDDVRAKLAEVMADVQEAIRQHGQELLDIPGVITVRPGYRFKGGKITNEPAIVVSVERKVADPTKVGSTPVPRAFGKVLVDVVEANPVEQYQQQREASAGPPTGPAARWRISTALPGETDTALPHADDELAGPTNPLLPYKPPNTPASEVNDDMTVVCHASCDEAWPLLKAFFDRTQRWLVSTMYEFTAPHILNALVANLKAPVRFTFVFDGKNKRLEAGDLTPAQVKKALEKAAGKRLTFAWAANKASHVVTAGFFPTAYHIKVSVRDGEEVWLSSGNWKSSNQPDTDPFNPPPDFDAAKFQREHNREWHVLIQNKELAAQFARYINHDVTKALPLQVDAAEPDTEQMPDLLVAVKPTPPEAGPPVFPFVKPRPVSGRLRALPLFTPDAHSYFDFVTTAVQNTKKSLWLENQSLSPKLNDDTYMNELILVLADMTHRDDLDVRIIVRSDFDPRRIQENLQASDFNLDTVKYLSNVHTKGLIIDGELVVIGSQNWTSQGVQSNRDASIVFYHEDIISYFSDLFIRDWNRADPTPGPGARLAGPEPTPAGLAKVPWSTVIEN